MAESLGTSNQGSSIKRKDTSQTREPQGPNIIGNTEMVDHSVLQNNFDRLNVARSGHQAREEAKGIERVTVGQFARNVHSKKDLLYALQVKGQIFVPQARFCSLPFLRMLMSGQRSYFKNSEVRHAKVPRLSQLSMKIVLQYALSNRQIAKYLPEVTQDDKEPQLDREFLFTIVNTINPNYFPEQLSRIETEKLEAQTKIKDEAIEVRPEIFALLESFGRSVTRQSGARSSARVFSALKKTSKKRTFQQYAEERKESVGDNPNLRLGAATSQTDSQKRRKL